MNTVVPFRPRLLPANPGAIAKVERLTDVIRGLPQLPFVTEHLLHAGMYTRSLRLPASTVASAVLVKPPTVLIVVGSVDVWSNDEVVHFEGYNVIPGSAGRKIAFITHSMVGMSMVFPCRATTVEQAEREFTSEHELLVPLSEVERHRILITGE